jgi:PASTA domain
LKLETAINQLSVALKRAQDGKEANVKNAQTLAAQAAKFQEELTENMNTVQRFIRQIAGIRSLDDGGKEWNKIGGKYDNERKALDAHQNMLQGRPTVPSVVGLPVKEAVAAIRGMQLTSKIVSLTESPPIGKAYTVKTQTPEGGSLADERGQAVTIEVYGQVVPDVVGLRLPSAVEAIGQAGLKVGGVTVAKSQSLLTSEKVTKQVPAAGEPAPSDKAIQLWHFDHYGESQAPTVPSKLQVGFNSGDGLLIHPDLTDTKISDGAYATPPSERISAIAPLDLPRVGPGAQLIAGFHGYKQGQDPPWDSRNGSLRRCTNEEEARRLFSDSVRIQKEFNAKPMAAGGQAMSQPAAQGVIGAGTRVNKLIENATYFYIETSIWGPYQSKAKGDWSRNEWRGGHVLEVYRDVFLISLSSFKCRDPEVTEDLEEDVRSMVENSKKLIDRRFPPKE